MSRDWQSPETHQCGQLQAHECHDWGTRGEYHCQGLPEQLARARTEAVDHPAHYGGADSVYETIKVIEAWGLGVFEFCVANCVKYVSRAGKKVNHTLGQGWRNAELEDLKKARWYLDYAIDFLEREARGEATEQRAGI